MEQGDIKLGLLSNFNLPEDEVEDPFFDDLFVVEKDDKRTGRKEIELRSTADLDTGEMTTAIERFRNWTASEGCYIPSPDEHRMVQLMEMELERNKMYLR